MAYRVSKVDDKGFEGFTTSNGIYNIYFKMDRDYANVEFGYIDAIDGNIDDGNAVSYDENNVKEAVGVCKNFEENMKKLNITSYDAKVNGKDIGQVLTEENVDFATLDKKVTRELAGAVDNVSAILPLSQHEDATTRAMVASKKLTKKELEKMSVDDSSEVRLSVASNPNTPNTVLYKMVGCETDMKVLTAIYENSNSDAKTKNLASIMNSVVELRLANAQLSEQLQSIRPSLSQIVADKLKKTGIEAKRIAFKGKDVVKKTFDDIKNLPTLALQAATSRPMGLMSTRLFMRPVLNIVATHATNEKVLSNLATQVKLSPMTLKRLAENPNASHEVLKIVKDNPFVLADTVKYIDQKELSRSGFPVEISKLSRQDKLALAADPNTSPEVLKALVASSDLKSVSLNEYIDLERLNQAWTVHDAVAKNPNASAELLIAMGRWDIDFWNKGGYKALDSILENPNLPEDFREGFISEINEIVAISNMKKAEQTVNVTKKAKPQKSQASKSKVKTAIKGAENKAKVNKEAKKKESVSR